MFCFYFRSVYVVVVPLKKGRGPIRHIKSPDEIDLEEVSNHSSIRLFNKRWGLLFEACPNAGKNTRKHHIQLSTHTCRQLNTPVQTAGKKPAQRTYK